MANNNDLVDDFDEFLNEFKDVIPLKNTDVVQIINSNNALAKQLKCQAIELEQNSVNNYLSVGEVEPVDPYDHLSFKQDGIQHGVFKNLRLGKYKIDAVINFQQLKFEAARNALFNKVIVSHLNGDRTILIKHGLGLHSKPFPAFLKSYIAKWLTQMPEVIAYHTALSKHGGNSAVYVLLKKNRHEKAQNREIFGKK
jgi:DNA-nicking Smr family endonuclease